MFKKKDVVKYVLLPGLLPRLRAFVEDGFSYLASLIAVVYFNAGLLPLGHPYLMPENTGRFGVRHVIAEAGRNLVFSRRHIDRIIIYFTVLTGMVMLFLQFFLLLSSFLFYPAQAATQWYEMFVKRPVGVTTTHDLSFMVLDRTFGIMGFHGRRGFFESCISDLSVECQDSNGNSIPSPTVFPLPFHDALHQIMQFYSLGLVYIATIILIYYVITIIGETMVSGTPFGQRFSRAWAVPRLLMFFALLIPMNISSSTSTMNVGISGGQFIVFGLAKFGSNLATNAWMEFYTTLRSESGTVALLSFGDEQSLIAKPNIPNVAQLTQFMHIARLCMYAQRTLYDREIRPYIVRQHSDDTSLMVKTHNGNSVDYATMGMGTDDHLDFVDLVDDNSFSSPGALDKAFQFSRYGNIVIRFGEYNPPDLMPDGVTPSPVPIGQPGGFSQYSAYVEPTCGELVLPFVSMKDFVVDLPSPVNGIQENYFLSLWSYLADEPYFDTTAQCMIKATVPYDNDASCITEKWAYKYGSVLLYDTKWLDAQGATDVHGYYNEANKKYITGYWYNTMFIPPIPRYYRFNTIDYMRKTYDFGLPPLTIRKRGWVGAGLLYNEIASINGLIATAVQSIPKPVKYPMVMEEIAKQHTQMDKDVDWVERYNPLLGNGQMVKLPRPDDQYIAEVLYASHKFWTDSSVHEDPRKKMQGNAILDAINLILGTNGLFDIIENEGVNPLAQLSLLGKSMVDSALQNMFFGALGQGIGELFSKYFVGDLAQVAGGFVAQFGMVGFSVGFILYYVLPFLPFLYFFFAFAGWIKSIFEAVVAIPLWALAHLKIDGDGLSGQWASKGYFLLFEIFMRPTLIIFGLVCSVGVFSALVGVLHTSFDLVLSNIGGVDFDQTMYGEKKPDGSPLYDMSTYRGPIDEIMYTVIYTVIVYMIALSSFKLIDGIPGNILRWIGETVKPETSGDPSQLVGQMYRASNMSRAQLKMMLDSAKGLAKGNQITDAMVQTGISNGT